MKLTKAQQNDIELCDYFRLSKYPITENHVEDYIRFSETGKGDVSESNNPLIEGKRWRGIHMQMYEEGILDGSMPYITILGGYEKITHRKWWKVWKPKTSFTHLPVPRTVVDFMKKEMFKGMDADVIEEYYQDILR